MLPAGHLGSTPEVCPVLTITGLGIVNVAYGGNCLKPEAADTIKIASPCGVSRDARGRIRMTPSEFAAEIVLPTVQEYFSKVEGYRNLNSRRLMYLSCIATYHICDHIAEAEGGVSSHIWAVRTMLRTACQPAFDVVEGICTAAKHFQASRVPFKIQVGSERAVPGFAYGHGGYGLGRYGGVGGFEVDHSGKKLFVDGCLAAVLESYGRLYPQYFTGVDLKVAL